MAYMILLKLTLICSILFNPTITQAMHLETYIVHLSLPESVQVLAQSDGYMKSLYTSYLPDADPSRMVHMYRRVITGFAAKLSPEDVKEMEKKEGFLYARPNKKYYLHTTHTPNFMGLYQNQGPWPTLGNYGKGVIIGVIDNGIRPNHPSFSDEGMPPPPAKWKGKCELNGTTCNNKLVGARNLVSPGSAVEYNDHGTHTSSTAAGNFVPGASVFGQANGTASGMAPRAHVAIYQVCDGEGCYDDAILAAFDAAFFDEVDVLSLSLGKTGFLPFYLDSIAIGAFRAAQNGIFVSCSAGNSGPEYSSLSNEAPWFLTVGASTSDRKILATAVLGNKEDFEGQSLNQPKNFPSTSMPLIFPGASGGENSYAEWCLPGSLDNIDVKGKIVLCMMYDIGYFSYQEQTVKEAGGAAMILMNDNVYQYMTFAFPFAIPATHVSYDAGQRIKSYINSTSTPTASIVFKGTVIGDKKAPVVAFFSSRGPNSASPGILKPDITGPGVDILAAWSKTEDGNVKTNAPFNMDSGTSMSCPHLSGIAALIKSAHPSWSESMIRSAIITSANQFNLNRSLILDEKYQPANVFTVGAGHVNPLKALDPGLVYDITTRDYISYLCSLYSRKQVEIIVQRKIDCLGSEYKGVPEAQLNYPSFSVVLGNTKQTYSRTVTNVGDAKSTYNLQIESVRGVNMDVEPKVLQFTQVNEQKTYKVYFSREEVKTDIGSYVQGSISWVSANHKVRIPVSVKLV